MKSNLLFLFSVSVIIFIFPSAHGDGGGGVDCPDTSGGYTYVSGSAIYETSSFGEDEFGVLFCDYESSDEGVVEDGTINAMFHIGGEISQDLSDEYGCGENLGAEISPLYSSSITHFAVVGFTTSGLQNIAEDILIQIEQQNLATTCTTDSSNDSNTNELDEETQQELEEVIEKMDEPVEYTKNEKEQKEDELGDQAELVGDESIGLRGNYEEQVQENIEVDSQSVLPDWIKNTAGWWASDTITDDEFKLGIEFLIREGAIVLPPTDESSGTSNEIPRWVKFNAGWWAEGLIKESEFIAGLQYLISNGIIYVSSN